MDKEIEIDSYMPGKIICIGMNYRSNKDEKDENLPHKPVLFSKARSCIIKDGENIIYPPEVSNKHKIPYSLGCGSDTEIQKAHSLGVEFCKEFPEEK